MNKHRFQENFEDSRSQEGNSIFPGQVEFTLPQDRSQDHPIQIVKLNKNKLQVCEEAVKFLLQFQAQVVFACLAGKYRTGKSFLLNKLMDVEGIGFKVDSAVNACTQGIWIWSRPVKLPSGVLLFFMDTEGTQSTNRDQTYDALIFSLAVLCSSFMMFNSVGTIDEVAISQLGLVSSLSKHILLQSADDDIFPKFIWILRDFVLKLQDTKGSPISANEYMQMALAAQLKGRSSDSTNRVRKSILTFFKDRECVTLIRPVMEDYQLKTLSSKRNDQLRPQFMRGVNLIRQKIIKKARPKSINGTPLTARTFADLLLSYVNTLNEGKAANIKSSWQEIVEDACITAYNQAIQKYSYLISVKLERDEPKSDQQIFRTLTQMREQTMQTFRNAGQIAQKDVFNKYLHQLTKFIDQKERAVIAINNELGRRSAQNTLADLFKRFKDKINKGEYREDQSDLMVKDLNQILVQYNKKALGSSKCQALVQYLTGVNNIVFSFLQRKRGGDGQLAQRSNQTERLRLQSRIQQLQEQNNELVRKQKGSQEQKRKAQQSAKATRAKLQVLQNELKEQKKKSEKTGCLPC